jgi:hypothetical protein
MDGGPLSHPGVQPHLQLWNTPGASPVQPVQSDLTRPVLPPGFSPGQRNLLLADAVESEVLLEARMLKQVGKNSGSRRFQETSIVITKDGVLKLWRPEMPSQSLELALACIESFQPEFDLTAAAASEAKVTEFQIAYKPFQTLQGRRRHLRLRCSSQGDRDRWLRALVESTGKRITNPRAPGQPSPGR